MLPEMDRKAKIELVDQQYNIIVCTFIPYIPCIYVCTFVDNYVEIIFFLNSFYNTEIQWLPETER